MSAAATIYQLCGDISSFFGGNKSALPVRRLSSSIICEAPLYQVGQNGMKIEEGVFFENKPFDL